MKHSHALLLGDGNNDATRNRKSRVPSLSSTTLRQNVKTIPTAVAATRTGTGTAVSSRHISTVSSTASNGTDPASARISASMLAKRVDKLFQQMQSHALVQTYEKLQSLLKIVPSVFVNGEALVPVVAGASTVSAEWQAKQEENRTVTVLGKSKSCPASSFQPAAGRFHYGRSIQYMLSTADPTAQLSLSTITSLHVTLTSALMPTPKQIARTDGSISRKSWQLVAETKPQIGLALYEFPLGQWHNSSLMVLVWTKTSEVLHFYLQLNIAELLHSAPERPIKVIADDVDTTYGLHSYTTAITIRSFRQVFWEKECYQVEFPPVATAKGNSITCNVLDEINASRDRSRSLQLEPSVTLATDAISYDFTSTVIVDFNMWDENNNPIWGFSRPLVVTTRRDVSACMDDLSLSTTGQEKQFAEMKYHDSSRNNSLMIQMIKIGAGTKQANVLIKQIEVSLSIPFINHTFGTQYPTTKA